MGRAAFFLLIVVLCCGCSSQPRIVVGSKNFTEQVILGEIVAQHLERRMGIPVQRKLNLGGTLLAHEAVKTGSIDLYPEYTGTALTAVLKQQVVPDASAVLSKVRDGYKPLGLTWMDPLGFDNTFAMVVRRDTASERAVRSLSDASRHLWKLGVGYEFVERPDGLEGLRKAYGLRVDGAPVTMDLGLLYPALQSRKVDLAAANSTDGRLASGDFVVLEDDRKYFPPYECAVVVRDAAFQQFPNLRPVLGQLSGRINADLMRKLNAAVDIQHRTVAEVAREFLDGAALR